MAEYLVQDTSLKAIADAIREKGGTSDNLEFPTAMAEAIAAIEAGGVKLEMSELTPAADVLQTAPLTVNHTLGVLPDFVYIQSQALPASGSYGIISSCGILKPRFGQSGSDYNTIYYSQIARASSYNVSNGKITNNSSTLSSFVSTVAVPFSDMTESTVTLCGSGKNSSYKLLAGSTYFLIVGAIVDE